MVFAFSNSLLFYILLTFYLSFIVLFFFLKKLSFSVSFETILRGKFKQCRVECSYRVFGSSFWKKFVPPSVSPTQKKNFNKRKRWLNSENVREKKNCLNKFEDAQLKHICVFFNYWNKLQSPLKCARRVFKAADNFVVPTWMFAQIKPKK